MYNKFMRINKLFLSGIILVITATLILATLYKNTTIKAPVRADAVGYFSYLPALFIQNDLSLNFMIQDSFESTEGQNTYEAKYSPEQARGMGFIYNTEKDIYSNKYPIGVAILLSPFFIFGHLLTILFNAPETGFSFFYQYSVFIGSLIYFAIGIFFLYKTLRVFSNKQISSISILSIIFATPLLNYATFENLYSHVFSFTLVSVLLYLSIKYKHELESKKKLEKNDYLYKVVQIFFIIGLIILVRQTNIIFILIPLFALSNVLVKIFNRSKSEFLTLSLVGINTLLITFLPQMLYWLYSRGSLLAYSYQGEGFSLENTYFLQSLFGVERGLFFWSPILLLSLIGYIFLAKNRKYKSIILSFSIIFIFTWVIVSTWSSKTFGWGYGHRIFVDMLPLFAIGLAYLLKKVQKNKIHKNIIYSLISVMIFLNIIFTIQYWCRILPPDNMEFEQYQEIFLNFNKERYWWEN